MSHPFFVSVRRPAGRGNANEGRKGDLIVSLRIAFAVAATHVGLLVPHGWHAPSWWLGHPSSAHYRATGAYCIHEHEGAWNANTGNGYYGGMQFLLSTWASVGGRGLPSSQSPREQLYRAWLVWNRDGHSWREWGTRWACGL